MANGEDVAVLIPTRNGGKVFVQALEALNAQTLRPAKIIVVDTHSSDGTSQRAQAAGCTVHSIAKNDFDHGRTRQKLAELAVPIPLLVYLTQDAILDNPDSLATLVAFLREDTRLGAVGGRQLPHHDANPLAIHHRAFNYPDNSAVRTVQDIPHLGIRAAFLSDAFAVYRREALEAVGGFPSPVLFGEDMQVAARMLINGWAVGYCAAAAVRHSHNYNVIEDFRRSVDIGAMHAATPWLRDTLGRAEGEGLRFVRSEAAWLLRRHPLWLIPAALHTAAKLLGYTLGQRAQRLPKRVVRACSMNKRWWG
jgi:rhamnosyltransferase